MPDLPMYEPKRLQVYEDEYGITWAIDYKRLEVFSECKGGDLKPALGSNYITTVEGLIEFVSERRDDKLNGMDEGTCRKICGHARKNQEIVAERQKYDWY